MGLLHTRYNGRLLFAFTNLTPTQITNAQILPNFFKPPQQYIHTLHNYTKLIAQTLPQIFRNLEKFQFYKYKKFSKKN